MCYLCKWERSAKLALCLVFLLAPLHGFAFWFDVEFNGPVRQKPKKQATLSMDGSTQDASPSSKKKKPDVSIVLSTAPEDSPTHWQQVI
jgi:type I protein arginine methyltransferase